MSHSCRVLGHPEGEPAQMGAKFGWVLHKERGAPDRGAGVGVPEPQGGVIPRGDQALAVRAEGNGVYLAPVTPQLTSCLGAAIPDAGNSVGGGGGEALAQWIHCHQIGPPWVTTEHLALSGTWVPTPEGAVSTGGSQPSAVRAEHHTHYLRGVPC